MVSLIYVRTILLHNQHARTHPHTYLTSMHTHTSPTHTQHTQHTHTHTHTHTHKLHIRDLQFSSKGAHLPAYTNDQLRIYFKSVHTNLLQMHHIHICMHTCIRWALKWLDSVRRRCYVSFCVRITYMRVRNNYTWKLKIVCSQEKMMRWIWRKVKFILLMLYAVEIKYRIYTEAQSST